MAFIKNLAVLPRKEIPTIVPDTRFLDIPTNTTFNSWSNWGSTVAPLNVVYSARDQDISSETVASQSRIRTRLIPDDVIGSPRILMEADLPPRGGGDGYKLSQTILFEPGFDWGDIQQNGKCGFGLAMRSDILSASPGGGRNANDGFQLRPVFFGTGSSGTVRLHNYYYGADKADNSISPGNFSFGQTGEYTRLSDEELQTGREYDLVYEVRPNSSASAFDGTVKTYLDGNLVSEILGRRMVSSAAPVIDRLVFNNFHGGNGDNKPGRVNNMQFSKISYSTI